jgi:hypothetical protein
VGDGKYGAGVWTSGVNLTSRDGRGSCVHRDGGLRQLSRNRVSTSNLTRAFVVVVGVHVHNSNLTRTVIVEMHLHVEMWSGPGVGILRKKLAALSSRRVSKGLPTINYRRDIS